MAQNMIRALVERYARDRSYRRNLPSSFGKRSLYLSPDSALQYLKLNWAEASRDLLAAAAKYVTLGDNVWDIGGNCGVFTFAAAHLAGSTSEIVSIEPDPFLASLLQRSASHSDNTDRNIRIVCAAVSNQSGLARFMIASRGRASNALEESGHRSQAGGTRYIQYVPTITLDLMLDAFAAPQVVKIDVEGAEEMVLNGGIRLLRDLRPILYLEVGRKQNDAVTHILRTNGYRLFNGDLDDAVEVQGCAFNTLAVPAERDITNRGITF